MSLALEQISNLAVDSLISRGLEMDHMRAIQIEKLGVFIAGTQLLRINTFHMFDHKKMVDTMVFAGLK